MVCKTQIPFKPNDIYFRLCYDFLKIAYLQKNKYHKRERNTQKIGKQVFFLDLSAEEGAWATVQGQTFVTGYPLQFFLFKGNKKVFPLLSLLCAAADIFSTFCPSGVFTADFKMYYTLSGKPRCSIQLKRFAATLLYRLLTLPQLFGTLRETSLKIQK